MRVLMALSGGVDSSVAAAELLAGGHEVVGITMRLWGGDSDTGCCSVADVDDARRVAQQLGIDHLVFNFSDDFHRHVVDPYVEAHRMGITPNPCIECNRHLKFDRLSERADALGFDAVATGHHARIAPVPSRGGLPHVHRGADALKDQAYVVHMLPARELARTLFPIGDLTKAEVRVRAAALGLRTAVKPDSQDVCFIAEQAGGRATFLGDRIPLRRAVVVDTHGAPVGEVDAVELVTLGQRRGLRLGGGPKRYVVDVDVDAARVVVGDEAALLRDCQPVHDLTWAHEPLAGEVRVQCSAHGATQSATLVLDGDGRTGEVRWHEPQRVVSPGQSVVFFDAGDLFVLGGGLA
jgi:tRNA-uridine 2-sulfurtransferase